MKVSIVTMPNYLSKLFCGVVLLVGFAFVEAHAESANPAETSANAVTEHVDASLVASVDAVYPGAEITLGIYQRIIPHWHTYWRNSGDSGIPTTVEWKLPQAASAGEIQWPIPSRFHIGPVTNYGYEHEVTLLSTIKVPSSMVPGSRFAVHATVNWLVCQESCVPEEVVLQLDLPVVANANLAGSGSGLIKKALASLPLASPWSASAGYKGDTIRLRIATGELSSPAIRDVYFYPNEWGKVIHHAEQMRDSDSNTLQLTLTPGESPAKAGEDLSGVLVVTEGEGDKQITRGFSINTVVTGAPQSKTNSSINSATPANTQPLPATEEVPIGLPSALLLALFGGLMLNLMPCVFPVLSIKAISLLNHANQGQLVTRLHGLAYTFGILLSFALLGGLLILLKAGGAQIGWGFQFQSPLFVLAVAYLMFAVGLSLSGVFTIGGSVAGIGSSLAEKPGYLGSFFTGVLATVVATPCTAPFMGAALGFALAQPAWVLLSVFISLGLGLALPYLLLSTWPLLQRWLPRPGIWMERVKQVLAFPMYLAAVWLVWVLAQQASANAVAVALGGMVAIAFAAWVYDSTRASQSRTRYGGAVIAIIALVGALAGGYAGIQASPAGTSGAVADVQDRDWQPYSAATLQSLLSEGKPVFLNLTAAWCITCLANERVALSDSKVKAAFKDSGITYLKGDWTNQDSQITALLKEFGRGGVPLYVAYPVSRPGAQATKPVILPQILTPEIVLEVVSQIVHPPLFITKE